MATTSTSTYDRLLDAATDEFAELGPAGARVDRICQRAGANKQLLYHHFGSKEGLFRAVLEHKLHELGDVLPARAATVADIAGSIFDFYAGNPAYVRLLAWESLHYGTSPVPGERARTVAYRAVVDLLEDTRSRGLIRADVETRSAAVDLIAIVAWPFVAAPMARIIAEIDTADRNGIAKRRESVLMAAERLLAV